MLNLLYTVVGVLALIGVLTVGALIWLEVHWWPEFVG